MSFFGSIEELRSCSLRLLICGFSVMERVAGVFRKLSSELNWGISDI